MLSKKSQLMASRKGMWLWLWLWLWSIPDVGSIYLLLNCGSTYMQPSLYTKWVWRTIEKVSADRRVGCSPGLGRTSAVLTPGISCGVCLTLQFPACCRMPIVDIPAKLDQLCSCKSFDFTCSVSLATSSQGLGST